MTSRSPRRRWAGLLAIGAVAGALAVGGTLPAYGHGWVGGSGSDLVARAALTSNTGLGAVQYEPQSLEGPTGFPAAGPADGHIASAGVARFGELDAQTSTRWVKNSIAPGPHAFGWTYTAPHPADEWRYYITKNGWNPNQPLTRDAFQLLAVVPHDGSAANTNPVHTVNVPSDHSGYHVILAVWEIADTANAFYNVIDVDISGGTPPTDVTAPTAPAGLTAGSVAATSIGLRWNASSDAVGVTAYRVFRGGVQVASTPGLSHTDTGLTASTAYRYTVRAVDAAGNVSAASAELAVTTSAPSLDTLPPSAPTGVHSMATTASSVDLMWTASTDDTGVAAYRVQRATGSGAFAQVASVTGTSLLNSGLAASTAYRYRVVAVDAAGNASAPSAEFSVTTAPAPTAPAWNPSGAYKKGDVVSHQGKTYVAQQDYQGHGDATWITALSLWKPVG